MNRRPIYTGIAGAAAIAVVALALKYATASHLVAPEISTRGLMALVGVALALYGNTIPKSLPRFRQDDAFAARKQRLLLTGGWLFTMAGIAYALAWLFAPLADASNLGMSFVGAATAIVAGYVIWARFLCNRARHTVS